jgi:hypothetical protein
MEALFHSSEKPRSNSATPTDAQRPEFDNRITRNEQNRSDVIPWAASQSGLV